MSPFALIDRTLLVGQNESAVQSGGEAARKIPAPDLDCASKRPDQPSWLDPVCKSGLAVISGLTAMIVLHLMLTYHRARLRSMTCGFLSPGDE